jgi:DNA-binding HxlR family transcriptional regulator
MEEPKMTEEPHEQRQEEERDERRMTEEELHAYMAGRAIVLQVLRDDHEERWTRTELLKEVDDVDPAIVTAELQRLAGEGVVIVNEERVTASPCARCLDALDLIGV